MAEQKLAWFPLYAKDLMSDRRFRNLSGQQMGAYLWLMMEQWVEGHLPFDIIEVLPGVPKGIDEAAVAYVLQTFFPPDPDTNLRCNPKLAAIRERQLAAYESRVGAATGARKSKRDNGVSSDQLSHQPSDQLSDQASDHVGDQRETLYIYNLSLGKQQLPQTVISAAEPYLRDPKTRPARMGSLRSLLQGMTGHPVPEAVLVRAVEDMAVTGVDFRPVVLRRFVDRAGKLLAEEAGRRAVEPSGGNVARNSGFAEDELE